MPKDRGIDRVDSYFGDFTKIIADRIKKKGKVKILDAGCGFGVAMMGFIKRFGDKVEIIGYNYSENDGSIKTAKIQAIEKRIFTKQELEKLKNWPKYVYLDASKKLPFKNNEFDFVYSMASLYLYDDKIAFLQECNRVLKKDGIARISPAFAKHFSIPRRTYIPDQYTEFWEVWDKGKEVKIWDYCKRIKGIKAVWKNKGKGDKPMYFELLGNTQIDFKLKLVASVDLNFIWEQWGGVKSIYTTQLDFKPKWKRR